MPACLPPCHQPACPPKLVSLYPGGRLGDVCVFCGEGSELLQPYHETGETGGILQCRQPVQSHGMPTSDMHTCPTPLWAGRRRLTLPPGSEYTPERHALPLWGRPYCTVLGTLTLFFCHGIFLIYHDLLFPMEWRRLCRQVRDIPIYVPYQLLFTHTIACTVRLYSPVCFLPA